MSGPRIPVGVEEEYHLVDRVTRRPAPVSPAAAGETPTERLEVELKRSMLESRTDPRTELSDVRDELMRSRRGAADAAREHGAVIAAAATLPTADVEDVGLTPGDRYGEIQDLAGQVTDEALVCACHVHVEVADADLAVEVCNRARPWLPVLLALSASSPFWQRSDTGFASYRAIVWDRWPVSGLPPTFSSADDHRATVDDLLATGVVTDRKQMYWDIRPSAHQPTVEFRVADVCTRVDDAVLQAALARGIVTTAQWEVRRDRPPLAPAPSILDAARWRAARFGLSDELVDVRRGHAASAATVVWDLVDHVAEALDAAGDLETVESMVTDVLERGTSADRQRAAFERTGRQDDVVDGLIAETNAADGGCPESPAS